MEYGFQFVKKDPSCAARLGTIRTAHGDVDTPAFMPVGTQGTIKALLPEEARALGAQMILSNTYHLYLRPGHELIRSLGGLHKFMNWPGPILTDSGGFQIFSLGALMKIKEDGVSFRSHIDGARHFISPETAVEIQEALGSDIMMCLDECTPYPATLKEARESLALTLRWAKRSRDAKTSDRQALFGILQGGIYDSLREEAAYEMQAIGFDGYALGGLSVGEPKECMMNIVEGITPLLPENRPRYLMGAGTPEDIVDSVMCGIDLFDCVIPTRSARNGLLFTNQENIVIKNARYRTDRAPVDETCDCYCCRHYSRAYLRHLFMAREILAMILNTIHNVRYYMRLMEDIRSAVRDGRFLDFRQHFFNIRPSKTGD
ncbi:MAG: tRNA guanosine(34) transglycosylase Tgt [Deltaproteobacteria bacterium]|nr:tRNA guanosine(34) transglycosylase Tgt [Deltaproteobacteria bacterium]